jgi:hypothetical protein
LPVSRKCTEMLFTQSGGLSKPLVMLRSYDTLIHDARH